jgi:excisionase family DNA binding protein
VRLQPNFRDREVQHRALKRAMSIRDFCERYNVGRTTVHQEIKNGQLKARKAGRRTLIGVEDAERWWRSLPAIKEAVGEAASLAKKVNAESPGITDCVSSTPMGEIRRPLISEERQSAKPLIPASTKDAAVGRRRRRQSRPHRVRGSPIPSP